jgi:ribosomal protein S18 acetylase RimI-like enzyme
MQDLIYRPFTTDDATAVSQVALEAWRYTYWAIYDAAFIESFVHTHYSLARLTALVPQVQAGAMLFHVAVHQDQVVGYCHLGLTPHGAALFRLYLLPAYIGRGMGWALLQHGEAFVRAHGLDRYFCFVHCRNEVGKRFYLRRGFRHVAAQDRAEEWYMEKSLA